ncbi:MAG: glycosyltransferase [Spirochaetes bacterium]|nr:glycosyltransferase [Spirochaetota bacterium]
MKILLLTSSFPSQGYPYHGIFVRELAEYITEYGHIVHVVAPRSDSDKEQYSINPSLIVHKFKYSGYVKRTVSAQSKGIPFSAFPYILNMFFQSLKIVRKEKIDIVHCYWVIPAGFVGILLSILTKVPVVATSPGSDLAVWSYRPLIKNVIAFILKRLSFLFTLGTKLRERALELGMPSDKITALLGDGGMNPRLFHPMKRKRLLRKKIGIPANAFLALYIGRLAPPKRLDLIFKPIAEDHNVYFLVIGDGVDRPKYETMCQKLDLQERVLFAGAIPHDDLPPYYAEADVIVYPSESEGLPSTIMEGMCMGVPTIASSVGGISDLIAHGNNGYLSENTTEAFSELFRQYIKDRKLQERMKKNAVLFARKNLYYTSIMKDILAVYKRLIEAPR